MGLKGIISPCALLLLSFLVLASADEYQTSFTPSPYSPSPKYETPSYTTTNEYTYYNGRRILPTIYGVQGVIYCSSCQGSTPIEGAVAKLSCKAETEYGYKAATFSMMTPKTDKNGYFQATFTPEQLGDDLKPINCKVYLESSPSYACNVATNINLGKTGAHVSYTRISDDYKKTYTLVLYSVPALVYTSNAKCEKPSYYKAPVNTPTPRYEAPTYSSPKYTRKSTYKAPTYTPSVYTP